MSATLTPIAPEHPEVVQMPQPGDWLTMAEIEERYEGEWVVLVDVEDHQNHTVRGGQVFAHGTNRDKVYACGPLPQPVNAAFFYVGDVSEDMWLML